MLSTGGDLTVVPLQRLSDPAMSCLSACLNSVSTIVYLFHVPILTTHKHTHTPRHPKRTVSAVVINVVYGVQ